MKSIMVICILIMGWITLIVQPAMGQSDGSLYFVVNYMRVPQDGVSNYLQVEQDLWKPIHAERMKRDLLARWSLYQVMFVAKDAAYNYVTVDVYDEFAKIDSPISQELFNTVHPDLSGDEFSQRTTAARALVHTEVWQMVDAAESAASGHGYIAVGFMHAASGNASAYVSAEQDFWKPVHQVRIRQDRMAGWVLHRLVFPNGSHVPYNYSTINVFQDLNNTVAAFDMDFVRTAHPNTADSVLQSSAERTINLRTLYKLELWELVDTASTAE